MTSKSNLLLSLSVQVFDVAQSFEDDVVMTPKFNRLKSLAAQIFDVAQSMQDNNAPKMTSIGVQCDGKDEFLDIQTATDENCATINEVESSRNDFESEIQQFHALPEQNDAIVNFPMQLPVETQPVEEQLNVDASFPDVQSSNQLLPKDIKREVMDEIMDFTFSNDVTASNAIETQDVINNQIKLEIEEPLTPYQNDVIDNLAKTMPAIIATEDGTHKCEFCGRKFQNLPNLRGHLRIHTKKILFNCPVCRAAFSKNQKMRRHVEIVHPDQISLISIKKKPRGPYMKTKVKNGLIDSVQQISVSASTFSPDITLASAAGIEIEHEIVTSNEMDSSLTNNSQNTEIMENSDHQFTCETCGRQFDNSVNLRRHVKIHLKRKLFNCPVCNCSFPTKYYMQRHLHEVHPNQLSDEPAIAHEQPVFISENVTIQGSHATFVDNLGYHLYRQITESNGNAVKDYYRCACRTCDVAIYAMKKNPNKVRKASGLPHKHPNPTYEKEQFDMWCNINYTTSTSCVELEADVVTSLIGGEIPVETLDQMQASVSKSTYEGMNLVDAIGASSKKKDTTLDETCADDDSWIKQEIISSFD